MLNPEFNKKRVQGRWGQHWDAFLNYERWACYPKDPAWAMYQIVGFRTTHWRPK